MSIQELIEKIAEYDDDKAQGYQELSFDSVQVLNSKDAAKFMIDGEVVWIPYSHLVHLDGEIYATNWILEKKGLS